MSTVYPVYAVIRTHACTDYTYVPCESYREASSIIRDNARAHLLRDAYVMTGPAYARKFGLSYNFNLAPAA